MRTAREQAEELWRKWKAVPQGSIVCHEHARDWWVNSITAALEEKEREIAELRAMHSALRNAVKEAEDKENIRIMQPERCDECHAELSQCGPPDDDGEPTLDCKVCLYRERIFKRDRQLAEAVTKIGWFASHASMGLARGGEGPAIGFLTDVKTHATAFLAKHTHTEKPDGKLQKPLDTHAKPL